MSTKIISYSRGFVIGNFLQEKIGIEETVDEGQDPLKVLKEVQEKVISYHKQLNPSLYPTGKENLVSSFEIPSIQISKQPTDIIGAIVQDISTVTDLKVLGTYRFIAKNHPELQTAIDKKEKELQWVYNGE